MQTQVFLEVKYFKFIASCILSGKCKQGANPAEYFSFKWTATVQVTWISHALHFILYVNTYVFNYCEILCWTMGMSKDKGSAC